MDPVLAHVAIVGGGSVAVSFLYQLIDAMTDARAMRIVLFEPRADIGPGTAYQHDLPSNLLNIPINRMSAVMRDPDSFIDWLRQCDPALRQSFGVTDLAPGSFVPRPLFGLYLQWLYRQAVVLAEARGVQIDRLEESVVGVWPQEDGEAIVQGNQGTRVRAAHVALCNGNLASTAFAQLAPLPGYFNSPYPVADLASRLPKNDTVCIIGTSLSAIDAIAALSVSGHQGRIVCVSRNGRLPAVRSPHNRSVRLPQLPEPESDGRVTLDGLLESLRRALRAAGGIEDPNDILGLAGDARRALDEEIMRSQAGARPWQAVAAATNERIEHIWHALDDAERARFHRDWRTLWMARRATFPLRNALRLQSLFQDAQLEVRGEFRSVVWDAAAGEFVVMAQGRETRARWLINATSFSLDVSTTADPLVRQLCNEGHARAHPLGGFDLDFDSGCLIDAKGRKVQAITVLGSLAAGTYFWTTSMEINARLAQGQAVSIARALTTTIDADRVLDQSLGTS